VTVRVGLANEEGFPHEGKLEFVDNQLDTRTGSVRMRATFANKDRRMAPGLFARVQIGGGSDKPALLISDRAVGTDQSHKFVFVVDKDNKAEYREVKLGPVVDGLRVVKHRPETGREDRRQRPAARASGRADHARRSCRWCATSDWQPREGQVRASWPWPMQNKESIT
jgi:hypothetical protein